MRQPRLRRLAAASLAVWLAVWPLAAARACHENAMLVFDASGSMAGPDTGLTRRIDTARAAVADVLPDVTRTRPTGLVTYGGVLASACDDVSLRLPPMVESTGLIMAELMGLEPSGQTPLTQATWLAAQALDDGASPGTIVVITDGRENCGLSACLLGAKLQTEAPNIKVHVIGFHLRSAIEHRIACLAETTGGTYTSVRGYEPLRKALREALTCPFVS